MIINLSELVRQCPTSSFWQHYQETFNLITQMQKEDEDFYDKYHIVDSTTLVHDNDVFYRGAYNTLPIDEKINAYIHCLRYSYFYALNGKYTIEFGNNMLGGKMIGGVEPVLFGAKLLEIGVPAVPAILNILEDRRPIIAVDEDKIPSKFYRYQDAAVEILQRMFSKAEKPFPVELPAGEYFSEYMEKQTPEAKQKIINDIKSWVEESMSNPIKPEEPPK